MSWDIALINSPKRVTSIEEIDDTGLVKIDFGAILDSYFPNVVRDDEHRFVNGKDFSLEYFSDGKKTTGTLVQLYGEEALFQIIPLAIKHSWQIFDTGSGEMLDLTKPIPNGFTKFQGYLKQILDRNE